VAASPIAPASPTAPATGSSICLAVPSAASAGLVVVMLVGSVARLPGIGAAATALSLRGTSASVLDAEKVTY
jgi:hypothetical protein